MFRFLTVSVAAIGALVASSVLAQGFVLKGQPAPGRSMTYRITSEMVVDQKSGEAKPESSRVFCISNVKITITSVEADGSAKADLIIQNVKVDAPFEGRAMGYEWPTAILPEHAPVYETLGKVLCGCKVRLGIDPGGAVSVEGGMDEYLEAVGKADRPRDRLLAIFEPARLGALLTPIFSADGSGDGERAVGKGWQTTETISHAPVAAIEITTNWSVEEADQNTAQYAGKPTIEVLRPAEARDGVAALELGSYEGKTTGVWDLRNKWLRRRDSSLAIETRWTLGESTLTQNQRWASRLEILEAE